MANYARESLFDPDLAITQKPPVAQAATGAPNYGIDPSANLPNTWQWNLTAEREIVRNTKLEIAYVGNRGLHILRYNDANSVPASLRLQHALYNDNADRPFAGGE